jgi:hypothetical protein
MANASSSGGGPGRLATAGPHAGQAAALLCPAEDRVRRTLCDRALAAHDPVGLACGGPIAAVGRGSRRIRSESRATAVRQGLGIHPAVDHESSSAGNTSWAQLAGGSRTSCRRATRRQVPARPTTSPVPQRSS